MIGWIFWRIVETLIIYAVCSLFTDPPNTLGITVVVEFILICFGFFRFFSVDED